MGHPVVYSSAGAIMARFNISKDSIYFPAGKRKGDKVGGISRLHTLQASNMSTIPLTYPQRPEMFHRPQGLWNPLVTKKLHVKNQSKLQSKRHMAPITGPRVRGTEPHYPHQILALCSQLAPLVPVFPRIYTIPPQGHHAPIQFGSISGFMQPLMLDLAN